MNLGVLKEHKVALILLVALCTRLYHIDFPVAGFQAWRQADTAAMARNFYENGFHLFYPQIDWGGNSSGLVETEFPLYSFLVAVLYGIFSPSDLWGRVLSVVCALLTIYYLYRLVRKILGNATALWAASIYAILPLNVFYTRAFMPESAMLMCSVLGIYFFCEWLDREKMRYWSASLVSLSLAALLKIPALYLGLPLFFLAWLKYRRNVFTNWHLWLFAAVVFTVVGLWYYHAHQLYLGSGLSFGIWFIGQDKWGIGAPLLTLKFYNDVFFKSIAERHLTYAGFIPFIIGLLLPRATEREKLFDWWLIALLVYFGIVTIGNQVHEYYQLPFVIPAVVYIAKTFHTYLSFDALRPRPTQRPWVTLGLGLCLIAIPILSFLRVQHFFKGERLDSSLFHLGASVTASTSPVDLVIAVDRGDPIVLYRSHRKGWHGWPCGLNDQFLLERAQRGATYLIGEKGKFYEDGCGNILDSLFKTHTVIQNTGEYFILRIE